MQLDDSPWAGVLWNTTRKTVITSNAKLAQNLLLYATGEKLDPSFFPLLDTYRKALDNPNTTLNGLRHHA